MRHTPCCRARAPGGVITIESALALEALFATDTSSHGGEAGRAVSRDWVAERVRLFDRLRVPRCNLTMLASNAGFKWLGVPGLEEQLRKYYSGPLPPPGSLPFGDEFREVLFHHDEFEGAKKALADHLETKEREKA